ncbi:MAG: hypothetical protein AAF664_19390, partial [Planctomycetota bacterium]
MAKQLNDDTVANVNVRSTRLLCTRITRTRFLTAIGLLLAFPGLILAVYWLPSSGPRRALDISVAANGTFTTSSWNAERSNQIQIDYWSRDLKHLKTIQFAGYPHAWAHSLSQDAKAVVTR